MRKIFTVLALSLFAALVVPNMAFATHSNGPGPDKDFINGAAKAPIGTPCGFLPGHFHANGQSTDPVTNVATGQFFTTIDLTGAPGGSCLGFTSAEFNGRVICVNAYGSPPAPASESNSANWRGVVEEVVLNPGNVPGIPGVLAAGDTVFSRHVDAGEPGAASGDRALGFRTPPGQTTCPAVPFTTVPITQGNLLDHNGI
jgi:hypothetical protein